MHLSEDTWLWCQLSHARHPRAQRRRQARNPYSLTCGYGFRALGLRPSPGMTRQGFARTRLVGLRRSLSSSQTGTYTRRSATAGSIRTARHAGSRAPRTQSAKAAPMTGTITPTLGLNAIRLPIVGTRGNAYAARKLRTTPRPQPIA